MKCVYLHVDNSGMKRFADILFAIFIVFFVVSCSTQKNTSGTRFVHSFKAKYNTYYNGALAYNEAYEAQRNGNKDNYLELLPFYITGNRGTLGIGKAGYERAIEKSQKTIKLHSITKKPDMSASKRRSPKGKAYLSQKEYNPFLYKAWFLMGKAQMQKGDYIEAISTFAYIQRLYPNKPNIVALAKLLEARCNAEMQWYFAAENIINETRRDSFPTKYNSLRAGILADCQLQQKQYTEAIPNLIQAIKRQKGTIEKARLYYLLGQLYHKTDQPQLAYKAFKKVYANNPPYELEFNARIQQTEVLSKGQAKQMIGKLNRMAKNPKNKSYLDQVYYAMGNIYLAKGDTLNAIYAYNDGVEKSTRSGIEKGIVWLHLGQLYWEREEFVKAQKCYAGVVTLLDKERDDYLDISERSRILDELLPYASAVELQDSLQTLAKMDSLERMAVIEKIIENLKKEEKKDARKMAEDQQAQQAQQANESRKQNNTTTTNQRMSSRQQAGLWYFYNPSVVASGKAEFQRKWGEIELADQWRLNRRNLRGDSRRFDNPNAANDDSGGQSEEDQQFEQEMRKKQEYEADPHHIEYYLKDIPLTEEQMAQSNEMLVDGLFNSAIIYKDQMENFPLAEKTFLRICNDFPKYANMDEVYYNLFQLYSRFMHPSEASTYKQLLIRKYPNNPHSILLKDPKFEYKGRYGKQIEDSLYQDAYQAYVSDDYNRVIRNADEAIKEYPEGANRPRFMFLKSMSQLNLGQRDQFMSSMRSIVENYPKSTVSDLANQYLTGLKDGRILANGKMDNGSVWERKTGVSDDETLATDTVFTDDKICNWSFVIAYEHDSIDVNQLLYEVARYNFSNFSVRSFDIEIQPGDGIDLLKVSSFLNYDEAYIYIHKIMNDKQMAYKLEGLKMFIISDDNLKKIMKGLSFADYFDFYEKRFDRIGHLKLDDSILDEPTNIPDPEDMVEDEEYFDDFEEEENYIF